MKLKDFTTMLLKLEKQYGQCQVFYRHGASGDCGELSSAEVTSLVDEQGPFDLAEGEFYISIYAGN